MVEKRIREEVDFHSAVQHEQMEEYFATPKEKIYASPPPPKHQHDPIDDKFLSWRQLEQLANYQAHRIDE
ncbi:hypothetical protein D3C80_1983170 [compost metagenome]